MTSYHTSIGVVGNGFVGNAIAKAFQNPNWHQRALETPHTASVRIYDTNADKCTHSLKDTVRSDFVFVCLPTPMTSAEGGDCDTSILENFFDNLSVKGDSPTRSSGMAYGKESQAYLEDDITIFVIKSTVPVGTTQRLCEKYPHLHIVHSPEFLTAANAETDFMYADRHVVGGNKHLAHAVADLYEMYFPNTPVVSMSSNESEAVKYFANTFLIMKVAFFNQMKELCDSVGANWENVHEGVITDTRIGESHTQVPGPDGQCGFGGTCFPKDLNALIRTFEKNGVDASLLRGIWEYNKAVREEWDWSDNESAVVQ